MSHITQPEGGAPASSQMPALFSAKRVRVQHIARAKAEGIPLTMLTAYDALTAPILEAAGLAIARRCPLPWRTWSAPPPPLLAQPPAP